MKKRTRISATLRVAAAALTLAACGSGAANTASPNTTTGGASGTSPSQDRNASAYEYKTMVVIQNNTDAAVKLRVSVGSNRDWESARPDHPGPEGFQDTVVGPGRYEMRWLHVNSWSLDGFLWTLTFLDNAKFLESGGQEVPVAEVKLRGKKFGGSSAENCGGWIIDDPKYYPDQWAACPFQEQVTSQGHTITLTGRDLGGSARGNDKTEIRLS